MLTQRTRGNHRKQKAGEMALPKEEHTNCLSNAKQSALKTHTRNII